MAFISCSADGPQDPLGSFSASLAGRGAVYYHSHNFLRVFLPLSMLKRTPAVRDKRIPPSIYLALPLILLPSLWVYSCFCWVISFCFCWIISFCFCWVISFCLCGAISFCFCWCHLLLPLWGHLLLLLLVPSLSASVGPSPSASVGAISFCFCGAISFCFCWVSFYCSIIHYFGWSFLFSWIVSFCFSWISFFRGIISFCYTWISFCFSCGCHDLPHGPLASVAARVQNSATLANSAGCCFKQPEILWPLIPFLTGRMFVRPNILRTLR